MTTSRHSLSEPTAPDRPGESGWWNRFRGAIGVMAFGYAALTVLLLAIGLLLVHALDTTVGRWDAHVNDQLAHHRTSGWNDVTQVATAAGNTLPVVVAAAAISGFLALRRRLREAAFLIAALVLEITVFLSVTFVVARPRPDVPRLNSTPSTSSFPSGHTAAATVLAVGVALIVTRCTRKRLLHAASSLIAVMLVGIVGFARVYRGMHHPTDVIVGALFGVACLAVAGVALRKVPRSTGTSDADADAAQRTCARVGVEVA